MEKRLLFLTVLGTLAVQAYSTHFFYLPIALNRIGFDSASTGVLLSVFSLATTIARPPGSFLTERLGVKNSFFAAAALLTLFSIPMAFTRSFYGLLLLRGLTGVAYGLCMVSITAFQAMAIPERGRGRAFSWVAVGYVLPQLILLPLLDRVFLRGFTAPYFWLIPLLGAGCTATAAVTPDLPRVFHEKKSWGKWEEAFASPSLVSLLASWVLFALANSAGLQFIPALLSQRGMPPSLFIVSLAATSLVVRLAASRFTDRLPRGKIAGISICLIGLGTLLVLGSRSRLSLSIFGAVYGLGMGFGFPALLALVPDVFPERLRPKGVALSFFAMDLGWIVSPLFVGMIGQVAGLGFALVLSGLIGLSGGAALLFKGWKTTP